MSMASDHLPGPHRAFTYEAFGLVSDAEGFVFLSGLVSALYALNLVAKGGTALVQKKMHSRASLIYLYHITLLFSLVLYGYCILRFTHHVYGHDAMYNPDNYSNYWLSAFTPFYTHPIHASLLALFLVYQPPLLDILPMYCVLQFIAPYIIRALEQGKIRTVLFSSISLWALSQLKFTQVILSWIIPADWHITYFVFDPCAWQLLFTLGFVAGYVSKKQVLLPNPGPWIAVASSVMLVGLWVRYGVVTPQDIYDPFMHRSWLGPFRLINALAFFFLVSQVIHVWRPKVDHSWLGWLGRYSLPVFTYHIVFIYLGDFWFQRIASQPNGWVIMCCFIVVLISSLAIPIYLSDYLRKLWAGDSSKPALAAS